MANPYGYPQQQQQPAQPLNPLVQKLFQPSQQFQTALTQGTLINFRYSFYMNDPGPLVILTKVIPGNYVKGINLHYLTYPYVTSLLSRSVGNPSFSYQNIKNDNYIVSAFRTYKWNGISQIRRFDSQLILTVMQAVRSIDPTQIAAIRQSIEQQINQAVANPSADSITAGSQQQNGVMNGVGR